MTEPGSRVAEAHGGVGSSGAGSVEGLRSSESRRQFARFLTVGAGNTVFGFATYALITSLVEGLVPFYYVVASLLAGVLNVTVSFLAYKWLVFRTRGDYLAEWIRAISVYSVTILTGSVLLPPLVLMCERILPNPNSAPYFAGGAVIAGQAVLGFIAHRRFTFRGGRQ